MGKFDKNRFGVSIASNIETLSSTVDETNNPSYKSTGEFMKMNFMAPASLAFTYGITGAN